MNTITINLQRKKSSYKQTGGIFGEPLDSGLPEMRTKRAPVMYTGDNINIDAARPKKLIPIAKWYHLMLIQVSTISTYELYSLPSYPFAQSRPYYQNQSFPMTNPIPSAPPASPNNSKPRIMSDGSLRRQASMPYGGRKKTKRRKKKIRGTRKANRRRR